MDKIPEDLPLPMTKRLFNQINNECRINGDSWKVWCIRPGSGPNLAKHFMVAERLLGVRCAGDRDDVAWKLGYFLPNEHKEAVERILRGEVPNYFGPEAKGGFAA